MNNQTKSLLLLIGKVITILVNIISMMLISRYLSIHSYAEYRQIITALTLVVTISSVGLPSSIFYFFSPSKKEYYLSNFYMVFFCCICLLIPISILSLYYFDYNFNTKLFSRNIGIFTLLFTLSFLTACVENLYIVYERFKLVVINSFVPNFLFLLLILTFSNNILNIDIIIRILLIREVIKLVFFLYFIKDNNFKRKRVSFKVSKEILLFSIPVGISSLISAININIDKLLIGKLSTKENFAIIANASYEIPVLGLIGASLFNILISPLKEKYEKRDLQGTTKLWFRAGEIMIVIVVPITMACIIFAKEVVFFLFSDKFLKSVPLFQIYQINSLSRIFYYSSFFLAVRLNKLYTKNALINLILNLILNLVLIKIFGLWGAALANVISTQILILLQNRQIARVMGKKIYEIFPVISFLKAVGITLAFQYIVFKIYQNLFGFNMYIGLICMVLVMITSMFILTRLINSEILTFVLNIYYKMKEKFSGKVKVENKKSS
ncbi:oligosaccharide flippase family protein [Priestia megaterium]